MYLPLIINGCRLIVPNAFISFFLQLHLEKLNKCIHPLIYSNKFGIYFKILLVFLVLE